ncbi:hypothetical protein niasHT_035496 [Heterodera trifolii]|uniref:Peptidase A2 domain-containing protein n=1 Tax=Heterodera trifolii TaxID=157864 RepID=A0ABD2I401_9BILA
MAVNILEEKGDGVEREILETIAILPPGEGAKGRKGSIAPQPLMVKKMARILRVQEGIRLGDEATENSLEVGWRNWPAAMFWRTKEVSNCYAYETVVFTRHGMEGLNIPTNDCPTCAYQSGSCRCPQISLIWKPDLTQRCAYVKIAEWKGEYSSRIWTVESGDFALTFVNVSEKTDTNGNEFVISDQTFAVPNVEFVEMLRKSEQANANPRKKRAHAFINGIKREYVINETDTTVKWLEPDQETKELERVGLVYSSQLAAQLTALGVKVTANTQKLFAETVQKICTSLRFLADQTLTLAEANPTLLARNKVIANLSELYSPDNFAETIEEPIKERGESVPVPLIKRWPSPESMPQTSQQTEREETEGRIARSNKNVTIAVAGAGKCDEKFRIIGKANDWGISLLLDTGAHVTLCGKNVALKLGLQKLEAPDIVAVIGISDKLIPILGKAEIKLQIAECAVMTTVYVVETKIG